jgi:hypothetical protein
LNDEFIQGQKINQKYKIKMNENNTKSWFKTKNWTMNLNQGQKINSNQNQKLILDQNWAMDLNQNQKENFSSEIK